MVEKGLVGLLIEDDPVDQLLITRLAQRDAPGRIRFDVVGDLTTGKEKLSAAVTPYDVVLLDLGLPEGSGIETLAKLLEVEDQTPVIVLTGDSDQQLANRAIRAGAEDYLSKETVNSEILIRSVQYAVERCALRTELEHARNRDAAALEHSDSRDQAVRFRPPGAARASRDEAPPELVAAYDDCVRRYIASIRMGVDRPAREVHRVARALIETGATAHDVLRLHVQVVNRYAPELRGVRAALRDARLVLVELLGIVMEHYRRQASRPKGQMDSIADDA